MAGNNDGQFPGDAAGYNNPALREFVGGMQTDNGQEWAGNVAEKVQRYLTQQAIIKQNSAAGQQFVQNMRNTSDGLVNLARSDPNAIDLALDLAKDSVNGIVAQHGHLDDNTRSGIASSLINTMQSEIAHGGIQALAETDRDQANNALEQYGSYLPDDQRSALSQYIDVQHGLRQQDAAAQAIQQQKDASVAGYNSAGTYLSAMVDPQSQGYRAPPGFAAQLVSDPSLSPATRLALHAGYGMLNQRGDAPVSDAGVLSDMVSRIASDTPPQQGEILSHLGSGLRVADAAYLNQLLSPKSPQEQANVAAIAKAFDMARSTLTKSENGPGGKVAFQRFTNWLMPALQGGTSINDLMSGNRLQAFAPTADDSVKAVAPKARVPLQAIFGAASRG